MIITAATTATIVFWAAFRVGQARRTYGVKLPRMYEDKDDSVFNCVQRAHQNTLEYLPSFLALLLLNGLFAPIPTAIAGQAWNLSRILYTLSYRL